jgi:putative transposase
VRQWARKFGQGFANQIRRRLPCAGDKWHLDEVCLMIGGTKHWLWRAVDQDGVVLDVLVQSRRDKKAAKRLLRKLLKKQCRAPRVMVTDKLASYGAAKGEVMPSVEHRRHKGLNNRAENSHQRTISAGQSSGGCTKARPCRPWPASSRPAETRSCACGTPMPAL